MIKKKNARTLGLGIGYVSIMLIFAVIGLTMLAVLSFQAAGSDIVLTQKSAEYTAEYYDADSRAKNTLAALDEAALEADSVFFEESFSELAAKVRSDMKISQTPEGVRVEYSEEISGGSRLYAAVLFLSKPDSERYRIERWQSGTQTDGEDDGHLNVWDGTF
ncbi:MAG: hypothetical protein ACI4KM_12840 [Oscillospiraceae bacterium]